jgi:hypothetical protein
VSAHAASTTRLKQLKITKPATTFLNFFTICNPPDHKNQLMESQNQGTIKTLFLLWFSMLLVEPMSCFALKYECVEFASVVLNTTEALYTKSPDCHRK